MTAALQVDPTWSRFQAGATGSDAAATTAKADAAGASSSGASSPSTLNTVSEPAKTMDQVSSEALHPAEAAAEASSSGPSSPPTLNARSEPANTMDQVSSEALHPAEAAAEQPDRAPAPVKTPARAVCFDEQQEVSTPTEAGEETLPPVEGLFGDTTPAASASLRWNEQTPAASVVQRHSLVTPGSRAGTMLSWLRASLTPSWRKQVRCCRVHSCVSYAYVLLRLSLKTRTGHQQLHAALTLDGLR